MAPVNPGAPQGESPTTHDTVPPQAVPTVEDKGLQAPTDDREQERQQGLTPSPKGSVNPAIRQVASNDDERRWAAFELSNVRVAAGRVGQAEMVKEARRIYDTMTLPEINAAIGEAKQAQPQPRTAGRIPVPRMAGGDERMPQMQRPAPSGAHPLAGRTAAQQTEDLAVQSLGAL